MEQALRDGLLLFAAYKERSENWPAHIMLIVQNLCKPIPQLLLRSPALTVWIAENVAHEVGHHVIAERKFALRPRTADRRVETEEEFADRFAASITAKLKVSSFYRFGRLLLRIAAHIDYYKGVHSWKKGKYEVAADYFYLATQLNPAHTEASYWFWKAKERATLQ